MVVPCAPSACRAALYGEGGRAPRYPRVPRENGSATVRGDGDRPRRFAARPEPHPGALESGTAGGGRGDPGRNDAGRGPDTTGERTMDVQRRIDDTRRTVAVDGEGDAATVTIAHDYATGVGDLWDACTDAGRLSRWFAPVSGDLRPGGAYRVEGNASGRVLACDPPKSFHVSWEFEGARSDVHVTLTPLPAEDGRERTRFELAHTSPLGAFWDEYGPGAGGVGWDLSVLGLTLHLETGSDVPLELTGWGTSAEALAFMERSGRAWEAAHLAAGADPEAVRACAERTIAAYTRAPDEASGEASGQG